MDQQTLAMPDPAAEAVVVAALQHMATPGSFFTGAERLAFAAHARVARGLVASGPELRPIIASTVARVAADAASSRAEHVAAWQAEGLDVLAFLELVAVVAQISSIDSYRVGIGAPLDALPEPVPGDPVPNIEEKAVTSNAWVPTVGIALAPTALSALPDERASKGTLGNTWYLTDKVIHTYDVEPGRELTRAQMELVASRTSWLNECFF